METPFQLAERVVDERTIELLVTGRLRLDELSRFWEALGRSIQEAPDAAVLQLDLSGTSGLDGAHAAAIAELICEAQRIGRQLDVVGLSGNAQTLLELYTGRRVPRPSELAAGDGPLDGPLSGPLDGPRDGLPGGDGLAVAVGAAFDDVPVRSDTPIVPDDEPSSEAAMDSVAVPGPPLDEHWIELWIERLGGRLLGAVREAYAILSFVGELAISVVKAFRVPHTVHWRDVTHLILRAGADAVPIVALINGLVGLIMAFQAAVQLKQVGANIFAADLVGLSVTREFGPLITAVVLAGRSGAAFAAEIGSMSVAEEIDALRTLGLDPYRFLVIPRVLALLVAVPILSLVADIVGILGGLLVGVTSLDLTPNAYLLETQKTVGIADVGSGLIKSVAFAMVIALVACQRGLAARGGAVGVGRSTTSSVVLILLNLIIVDSAFTWLFHVLGM